MQVLPLQGVHRKKRLAALLVAVWWKVSQGQLLHHRQRQQPLGRQTGRKWLVLLPCLLLHQVQRWWRVLRRRSCSSVHLLLPELPLLLLRCCRN